MAGALIKDHTEEGRSFAVRALIAGILVFAAMSVVMARLVYLQVGDHERLYELSEKNRFRSEPLPPTRGLIYDVNGVLAADNEPSKSLDIVLGGNRTPDAVIAELGAFIEIGDADLERFEHLRRQRARFGRIPIRTQLTQEEEARFAVNSHRFPEVVVSVHMRRTYPLGEYLAHVLGYIGRINQQELDRIGPSKYAGTDYIGKVGVEKFYEDRLYGAAGQRRVEVNARGRVLNMRKWEEPEMGSHLRLFLDTRLQKDAYDALGDRRGAVVAMDPNTGGVLALVSRPSFDPNLFVDGISLANYAALRDSPDKPLFNRAIRGQYPPGSTVKPFMGLGGLKTGVIDFSTAEWCPGYYRLPGSRHKYRCWNHGGHGTVSLRKAIIQSCDVYFYKLAQAIGIDRLHEFLGGFHFGRLTGIDMPGELGGLVPSKEWKLKKRGQPWSIGETLIVGIGQGAFLATPLQLAAATAAVATRGRYVRPRLLKAIKAPGTNQWIEEPQARGEPIPLSSETHLDRIIASMLRVVEDRHGTAKRIRTRAYRIAGKTGTAQVFTVKQTGRYRASQVAEHMRDHALFVAFAPVDKPTIAVAVIAENSGHGGSVAAPIARKVMDSHILGGKAERVR